MGGKSSSKSSTSTTTTYNTEDGRLYVEDGGFGVGAKSDVDISITDAGAVDLTAATLREGGELLETLATQQNDLTKKIVSGTAALLAESTQDDAKEVASMTIKLVLLGTTALGALYLLPRVLRK